VDTSLHVSAFDSLNAARTSGGDKFFLHVQDLCTVGTSFFCEESSSSSGIMGGNNIYQLMTDNTDGTYDATYQVNQDGQVSVSVILAKNGGFLGEYFNNVFLDGAPAKTQIDTAIDFDWGTDLITD